MGRLKKGQKCRFLSKIQVTYLLVALETIQREFGVYDYVRDNFSKYVVTMDEIDMSQNGIKHKNIRKFLTMEEW